ncbi:hypothetical protein UT300005_20270 [Clostridium sp. CTA-5]
MEKSKEIMYGKIQGFLDSIALTNSIFNYYVGYTFEFYKIEYNQNLISSVRNHIFDAYKTYLKINCQSKDNEIIFNFDNNFNLEKIDNWEERLKLELPQWFMINSLKQYENSEKTIFNNNIFKNISIIAETFIDYLKEFFDTNKLEVWEFNSYFKNNLIYFWGGLSYSDYIFSFQEDIYILHLDFVD